MQDRQELQGVPLQWSEVPEAQDEASLESAVHAQRVVIAERAFVAKTNKSFIYNFFTCFSGKMIITIFNLY